MLACRRSYLAAFCAGACGWLASDSRRPTSPQLKYIIANMPRHANLPFHLYVHVCNTALGPNMPTGTTRGIWHAIYARPGQVVTGHVLLETGAEWAGVPLHKLGARAEAFERKALPGFCEPHDLQPWGAMGDHAEVVHMEYLEGLAMMGVSAERGFCGRHTGIVIDWADGFSRYPQEHKPLNLIERSDGRFLLFPNNYCRFMDFHFTSHKRDADLAKYRRGEDVYWLD